jgi:hypothetical protein
MITKRFPILILVHLLANCSFLIRPQIRCVLENDTDKTITVLFYAKSEGAIIFTQTKLVETLIIKPKSRYEEILKVNRPGDNLNPFPEYTDSVIINFDDKKYIRLYCDGRRLLSSGGCNGKNRYNLCNFQTGDDLESKKPVYKSKIIKYSEADYEKAEFL